MTEYTSHLARDEDRRATVCGEPWQGWQEPDLDGVDEVAGRPLPPHAEPQRGDRIRQCAACFQAARRQAA